MRTLSILLLSVALAASAGCFGKDDGGDGTPTPTTPGGNSTPTTSTPTTTTPATNTTPTAPVRPAPRELCPVSKAFSSNLPTPPATAATSAADCGTAPAGFTSMTLVGNWTAENAAPVIVSNAPTVSVLDAAGTVVTSCAGPGPGQAATTACSGTGTVVPGTAYTLRFDGEGNVQFTGSVMIS